MEAVNVNLYKVEFVLLRRPEVLPNHSLFPWAFLDHDHFVRCCLLS